MNWKSGTFTNKHHIVATNTENVFTCNSSIFELGALFISIPAFHVLPSVFKTQKDMNSSEVSAISDQSNMTFIKVPLSISVRAVGLLLILKLLNIYTLTINLFHVFMLIQIKLKKKNIYIYILDEKKKIALATN